MSCNHLYQVPPPKTPTHQLTPRSSLPRPLATTHLPSVPVDLPFPHISHKWDPTLCGLWGPASLTERVFKAHPRCGLGPYFSPRRCGQGHSCHPATAPSRCPGNPQRASRRGWRAHHPGPLLCRTNTPRKRWWLSLCGDRVRPEPTLLLSFPGCCVYAPLGQGD